MANPTIIPCPKNTWVKVAAGVAFGNIHVIDESPGQYTHTYREKDDVTPLTVSERIPFKNILEIQNSTPIDVYVYCIGKDGEVRVDI